MKKALIFQGELVEIAVKSFPVSPEMHWVNVADDVTVESHIYDGATVVPTPPKPLAEVKSDARSKRNSLLAATDWTQAGDIPQATKDLWTPYRQALREVPEQTGFPNEIVWPVRPA